MECECRLTTVHKLRGAARETQPAMPQLHHCIHFWSRVATNTHAIATMATPRYTLVRRLAALVTPPATRSVASRCMQRISIVKTQLVQPQCYSIHTVAASHAPQQASDGSSTTPDLQVTRSKPAATATATATPTAESCGPVDDLDSDRCNDSVCAYVCESVASAYLHGMCSTYRSEDDMVNMVDESTGEWGGPTKGGREPEPTRFGDWQFNGRCTDF